MLIKLAEYAAQRGVTTMAVRKAIKEGRIQNGATKSSANGQRGRPGWLIDPEIADREWNRNTAPQFRQGEAIRAGIAEKAGRAASPPTPAANIPSMAQGQAIKVAYQAKLLQLEFEEKSGRLVSVEEMKRQRFESGRQVRDAVLRIGPQMIGEIAKAAGGLNPDERAEVLLVIQRYLVQALEALADGAGQG